MATKTTLDTCLMLPLRATRSSSLLASSNSTESAQPQSPPNSQPLPTLATLPYPSKVHQAGQLAMKSSSPRVSSTAENTNAFPSHPSAARLSPSHLRSSTPTSEILQSPSATTSARSIPAPQSDTSPGTSSSHQDQTMAGATALSSTSYGRIRITEWDRQPSTPCNSNWEDSTTPKLLL